MHITSGFSALAAALVIGQPTKEVPKEEAHSLPLVFIGTALLWFGWSVSHPLPPFNLPMDVLLIVKLSSTYLYVCNPLPWPFFLARNGFNGGSALSAGGVAALATVNTNVSACMGMLTWMACDGMVRRSLF